MPIGNTGGGGGLGSVALSGAAAAGQVIEATSSTAATWQNQTLTLLYNLVLGADGTFDQATISQAYSDLVLIFFGRSTDNSVNNFDGLIMRVNNDSGANYIYENMQANITTLAASGTNGTTRWLVASAIPNAQAAAGLAGCCRVELIGYANTSFTKPFVSQSHGFGSTTQRWTDAVGGTWNSTAAITRVQVLGQTTSNLVAGSSLRIYGRL